jgi:hypothetical protein
MFAGWLLQRCEAAVTAQGWWAAATRSGKHRAQ